MVSLENVRNILPSCNRGWGAEKFKAKEDGQHLVL